MEKVEEYANTQTMWTEGGGEGGEKGEVKEEEIVKNVINKKQKKQNVKNEKNVNGKTENKKKDDYGLMKMMIRWMY